MPSLLLYDALHPLEVTVALRMKGPEDEEGEESGEPGDEPVEEGTACDPLALFLQLLG